MDRNEAHQLLVERMQHYTSRPYSELERYIGGEHLCRLPGENGSEYCFELYVSRSCERSGSLEIEGFISEVNGACIMSALEHLACCVEKDGSARGLPAEVTR